MLLFVGLTLASTVTLAGDNILPYQLKSGKPYAGTTLNILAVVTPQFKSYELRDEEFESLTGIKLNWTHTPFVALQEKVSSVGVAADGSFDVVNYLDSWGPSYAYWLEPIDAWLKRDGIDMNRYPEAFKKSAMFKGETLGFPLRAHPQLMFYRKDLFDKHNLKAPKSWSDVVSAGKTIKSKEGIGGLACYYGSDGNRQNLFIWLNFLCAAGADVFDSQMKPAWTTSAGLKATRDYIDLHTKHGICGEGAVSNVEQDARIQYAQGKAAMIPVWWWAYSGISPPPDWNHRSLALGILDSCVLLDVRDSTFSADSMFGVEIDVIPSRFQPCRGGPGGFHLTVKNIRACRAEKVEPDEKVLAVSV